MLEWDYFDQIPLTHYGMIKCFTATINSFKLKLKNIILLDFYDIPSVCTVHVMRKSWILIRYEQTTKCTADNILDFQFYLVNSLNYYEWNYKIGSAEPKLLLIIPKNNT